MRILVDMDGVIANWGQAYNDALDRFGMAATNIPRHEQQVTFDLNADRTKREREIISAIMVSEGFYSHLKPIQGANAALKSMLRVGHDVRICTSPWVANPTCASEKLNWVADWYGFEWAARVILTTDKTLVHGDFLIDDKPSVTGSHSPSWEHVLFDQPYNIAVEGKRRIRDWGEWKQVLA